MASLDDIQIYIDNELAEQVVEQCKNGGGKVIEIQMKKEQLWASVTGTQPKDWELNYKLPPNAGCRDRGQKNAACGVNANPRNGCGGGLITGPNGICNMGSLADILQHVNNVYNAFNKIGGGGCVANNNANASGRFFDAAATARISWEVHCITKDGGDEVLDSGTSNGSGDSPIGGGPPTIRVVCMRVNPGPITTPTQDNLGRYRCANGQLSSVNCGKKGIGYYCCPGARQRGTCAPALGFYQFTGSNTGYAASNCPGGKNAEYFGQAPAPSTIGDLVNYASDNFSGAAGYFASKSAAHATNPFKDVDVDAEAAKVVASVNTAAEDAVSAARSAFARETALAVNLCANKPGCSHSFIEITDFEIDIYGTDPDGVVLEDPDDPLSPVIPRPDDGGDVPTF